MSDANLLLELAKADYLILRLKKQLNELPQRARLLELRTKKAEVEAKAAQVAQMRREREETIKALNDEEESLYERIAKARERTNKTTNYKEVVSLSKEIDNHTKRLEKVEYDSLKQMERLDRIALVEEQVILENAEGQVIFEGGMSGGGHINPQKATIWTDSEYGELSVHSWEISDFETGAVLYTGKDSVIDGVFTEMYERGENGQYMLRFFASDITGRNYSIGNSFIIYNGS